MSGRFHVETTPLEGLVVLRRKRMGDERGWLERLFCSEELLQAGWNWPVVQLNRTLTMKKGTVRGMHYQRAPHQEAKLVTCLRGEVFDVAVDLRAGSPTRGKWHGAHLSNDNASSFLIPPGFAHGFQTLTDNVEMFYVHSAAYAPQAEEGVLADDPGLGISWPLEISEQSDRDRSFPAFSSSTKGSET